MTRPGSEPERVKNDAHRSKNQAEAPVTSHQMRSGFLSQVALPLSSSCVGFVYHKPEGVVHKPFKRDRIAKMYARGAFDLHRKVRQSASLCSSAQSEFPMLAIQARHFGRVAQPANGEPTK